MKAATAETPDPGQVVETVVTRKRTVAADAAGSKERTTPEFWVYLESLTPVDWERHMLYVYRKDGEIGPMTQLEKCIGEIVMADGTRVPTNNREDTEFAIVQKYGGGLYRLILKKGSERVSETRVYGEGPKKQVQNPSYGDGPTVTAMSETNGTVDVATTAIRTIANQERSAFEVATNALKGAADVVQRFSQPSTPAPASENDVMFRALMLKMMERMMTPPDPIETLTKLLAVTKDLGLGVGAGAGGVTPTLQKVVDSAIEKLLNPTAAAGPASDNTSAELVRVLPGVASYAVQGLAQWRAGVEAQRDTAAIMARGVPVPPARPNPNILAPPAPPPPANGTEQNMGAPSLEFIESRIVAIFQESTPAEEAANRVLEFLDTIDPNVVEQLKSLGEAGVLNLFQSRPVLRPALANLPRLQEFIRAFLKEASENDPPAPGTKPN